MKTPAAYSASACLDRRCQVWGAHLPILRLIAVLLSAAFVWTASAAAGPIETRSTFHCISLYWSGNDDGPCRAEFRPQGGARWQRAQDLVYDSYSNGPFSGQHRGSIVNLKPGTDYEIRLSTPRRSEQVRVSTWSEHFKIRKTIRVRDAAHLVTTEGGGAAEGYVLYDGGGTALIDAAYARPHCIEVRHGYVILRGIKALNAGVQALIIGRELSDMVVEHCDISRWGRQSSKEPRWGRTDAAVLAGANVRRFIFQRNRVHHPTYTATYWNEDPNDAHPRGPRALHVGGYSENAAWEANHVIRYNEFFSDPEHMMEDVIGGGMNYSQTGTPGKDSDIYGNIITHATDDLIEADGGGMNVRIWGNYMAYGFIPLSLQSCPLGPVYYFRNIIGPAVSRLGREKPAWTAHKFVSNEYLTDPVVRRATSFQGPVFVYHNSVLTPDYRTAFTVRNNGSMRRVVSRNNIFLTSQYYLYDQVPASEPDGIPPGRQVDFVACSFDYDIHNAESRGDSVPAVCGSHGIRGMPEWRSGHGLPDSATGRFQLAENAPGRNAGTCLPNFNQCEREEGGAPDIGAHEFGSSNMSFGVTAHWPVQPLGAEAKRVQELRR